MHTEFRHTFTKDYQSFDDWEFIESGNRTILKRVTSGTTGEVTQDYTLHEPEIITREEFLSELDKNGLVTRTDTYIDPDSLFEVIRGSIVRNDIEHFFHVMYPPNQMYKHYMTGVISTILNTRKVEDDDGI